MGERREAAEIAQELLVIKLGGDEWRLAWRNVPMVERMLVRKWTGLPLSAFVATGNEIDQDSLALLWCLARRAAGEKTLVFSEELVETFTERLSTDEFEVNVEQPDATTEEDPEA